GPRGPAGRWARAAPDRRQLGQPPQSWPHCPQPSQRSAATGPRWVLPGVAPAPAPKGRLFVREWRQRPPHTAQSPARTLLLPDACPTSNPKTQQPPRVAWTEFLYPTLVAKSRRGHPLLALQNTARAPCSINGIAATCRPLMPVLTIKAVSPR